MAMRNMVSEMKIALIQLAVTSNKQANLKKASNFVKKAADQGAKLICLPECFNSPYGIKYFPEYAEAYPGETSNCLSDLAKSLKIYLIGGSIPEKDEGKLYNTSLVFGPDGSLLAKHRKVHLFDIDIPGKFTFKESDGLSPGDSLTTFTTSYCKVGLGICYDIRFAPMAQIYAQAGCQLLIYPGAFNMVTGPKHWELLQRARAVDNQVFVAAVSPARDEAADYVAWGHTSIVNPWGEVIAAADHSEQIVFADLDFKVTEDIRNQIPITRQKRDDLYEVVYKKKSSL